MKNNIHTKEIITSYNFKHNIYDNNVDNIKDNKYSTKIVKSDFFSLNEINICNIINEIPYFYSFYDTIVNYDYVTVGELNEYNIDDFQILDLNDNSKYFSIEYKDYKYNSFDQFLLTIKTPKQFISHIFSSYTYLLNSLIILNDNDICFFDLSPENIIFPFNNGINPILTDFQKSIYKNKLTTPYIINLLKIINNYTYKPLEIHLLFYIFNNNTKALTHTLVEQICKQYVKNMSVLLFFSEKYRMQYFNTCIDVLSKYINTPIKDIIDIVLKNHITWDNYSLSVIYLHLISNVSIVFSLKHNFITKLIIVLLKNISPNPYQRESLQNTLNIIQSLFNDNTDWTNMNQIPISKMELLFKKIFE